MRAVVVRLDVDAAVTPSPCVLKQQSWGFKEKGVFWVNSPGVLKMPKRFRATVMGF